MPTPTITNPKALQQLCDRLATAPVIGIDTEFVSEDTYFPDLCLIQISTEDELAVIDPLAAKDLRPFWKVMVEGDHVTVLHAGREELNFFLRATKQVPKKLFDVQIASGFCSNEFPSAYGSVVNRFLGVSPAKGEQRTDWRRRPLTDEQVHYALEDVRYLLPLYDRLTELLKQRERLGWLDEEMANWQNEIVSASTRKDWRRVSGIGKLTARNLAIVRELWHWRNDEAQRRDQPPRRILRDDLLVELAKRKVDTPERIMAIRGMERSGAKRKAVELAECVRKGLNAPLEGITQHSSRVTMPSQLNLLGQFLAPALGTLARRAEIAASLVGTASDVRELIAYRLGFSKPKGDEVPILASGWREILVGTVIDDLLQGKKSIRIVNATREDPLVFEDFPGDSQSS